MSICRACQAEYHDIPHRCPPAWHVVQAASKDDPEPDEDATLILVRERSPELAVEVVSFALRSFNTAPEPHQPAHYWVRPAAGGSWKLIVVEAQVSYYARKVPRPAERQLINTKD